MKNQHICFQNHETSFQDQCDFLHQKQNDFEYPSHVNKSNQGAKTSFFNTIAALNRG